MISVIIPTYNSAKTLRKTIESVLRQSYANYEIIVIDNNSTDNTVQIINSLDIKNLKLLKIENDGVIAKSRNLGIYQSSGEYIAFLDSDDSWTSEKLAESIKVLETGYDVVYHDLLSISPRKVVESRELTKGMEFEDLLMNGNALTNSSVVVKKEHLKQVGYLSEDIRLAGNEDFDLWLRLASNGTSFKRIDRTLGYYTIHEHNFSNSKNALSNLKRFKRKYHDSIKTHCGEVLPIWLMYKYSRLNAQNGNYKISYIYGCKVLKYSNEPRVKIKSLITVFMCFLQISKRSVIQIINA